MERLTLNSLLETKKLNKTFGGVKAVNDCDIAIEKGKIVALIGPNGSGKTTLFNLIAGVLTADSGKIILENVDITNFSVEERVNFGISRLFQQSRLFPNLTIEENLLLALNQSNYNMFSKLKATSKQKEQLLEVLGLFEMTKKINSQAKALSFGQRRLIEIARTYLLPHKIMLLDEPVAGVTPHLRDDITKFLIKLREEGETILIIEHDMNFVFNLVNDIIVMDAGKIIAEGKPEEIKNNKLVKAAYLGE